MTSPRMSRVSLFTLSRRHRWHRRQACPRGWDLVHQAREATTQAAGEVCPIWPGHPITAHWGVPDPAAVEGSEIERVMAFRSAFRMLERRIQLFLALRHKEMSRAEAERKIMEIGRLRVDAAEDAAS
jgi:hypothetical protein